MKPYKKVLYSIALLCFSSCAFAGDPITDLLGDIDKIQNRVNDWTKDIDGLTKDIQASLKGITADPQDTKGFDIAQWGSDAQSWQDALSLAEKGGSSNALGNEISKISTDFPIDTNTFNKADPSAIDQKFYKERAETVLAARAASQLDYDKLQSQIDYQKSLKDQVYKTTTLKQSVDLQNQLQVEHNLISLELLRQAALSNQQQALKAQEEVNGDIKNAQFSK